VTTILGSEERENVSLNIFERGNGGNAGFLSWIWLCLGWFGTHSHFRLRHGLHRAHRGLRLGKALPPWCGWRGAHLWSRRFHWQPWGLGRRYRVAGSWRVGIDQGHSGTWLIRWWRWRFLLALLAPPAEVQDPRGQQE